MKRLQLIAVLAGLLLLSGFQAHQNNFAGPSQRIVGSGCLAAAGNSLTVAVQNAPTSGMLRQEIYIPGYGAPGDTLAEQFNGDTGNNYRYAWETRAVGGATADCANVANTTDRIKLGCADTQQGRVIEIFLSDFSGKTEKIANMSDTTGTGAVGTQSTFDQGTGAWVSGANVTINSIRLFTSTANMAKGTCLTVYAR